MELVCPAGNLPSFRAAVDNGADAVYIGFKNETNARHFAGLNFNDKKVVKALQYAKNKGIKVFVAINTYPQTESFDVWARAVDQAAEFGVDAMILADIGLLDYASERWPDINLHLSVQASATNPDALKFYHRNFNIKRAVLPRVLSVKQVAQVAEKSPVALEVFGFGSLCVMVEGRCILSSYVTGLSPNTYGACSPGSHVKWNESNDGTLYSRLNGVLIDQYTKGEKAGYPTLCKGRFSVDKNTYYAIEEPTSLNALSVLPELYQMGISALKVEGRQRSPAYVAEVTRILREALDSVIKDSKHFTVQQRWQEGLADLSEGSQTTLGAYHQPWQ
jgi:O2-independent ubiquinone biosynthesis protein UbiU